MRIIQDETRNLGWDWSERRKEKSPGAYNRRSHDASLLPTTCGSWARSSRCFSSGHEPIVKWTSSLTHRPEVTVRIPRTPAHSSADCTGSSTAPQSLLDAADATNNRASSALGSILSVSGHLCHHPQLRPFADLILPASAFPLSPSLPPPQQRCWPPSHHKECRGSLSSLASRACEETTQGHRLLP